MKEGESKMKLRKEEFEKAYAEGSGLTLKQLHEHRGHGEPCDCDADNCRGWQMVFPNREFEGLENYPIPKEESENESSTT